jgi:hypothetical protein
VLRSCSRCPGSRAAITHARRKETPMIAIDVVLLVRAVVVAWGRFGPYSFTA